MNFSSHLLSLDISLNPAPIFMKSLYLNFLSTVLMHHPLPSQTLTGGSPCSSLLHSLSHTRTCTAWWAWLLRSENEESLVKIHSHHLKATLTNTPFWTQWYNLHSRITVSKAIILCFVVTCLLSLNFLIYKIWIIPAVSQSCEEG